MPLLPSPSLRLFSSLLILGFAAFAIAQPPAGYYSAANGLRGAALESALRNIIDGHTSLSYDGAKDRLWTPSTSSPAASPASTPVAPPPA
jgi:hypothetical protein